MTQSQTDANPRLALIEERLGESLTDLVAERRTEGVSWRRIAMELFERTRVDISGEAVRVWHNQHAYATARARAESGPPDNRPPPPPPPPPPPSRPVMTGAVTP